jgi:hypothetical protein
MEPTRRFFSLPLPLLLCNLRFNSLRFYLIFIKRILNRLAFIVQGDRSWSLLAAAATTLQNKNSIA